MLAQERETTGSGSGIPGFQAQLSSLGRITSPGAWSSLQTPVGQVKFQGLWLKRWLSLPHPGSRWPGERCCWLRCCSKGWNRAGGAQGKGSGGKWKCGSHCQSRCRRRCHEPHNPGRLPPGGEGRARIGGGTHQCLPGTHCPSSAWSPRIHSGGIRRPLPSGLRSPCIRPGPIRTCLPPPPPSSAGPRRCTDCPGQCCSGKIFQGCRAASAWCLHSAHISCPQTRWGESRQCLDPAAHPLRKKVLVGTLTQSEGAWVTSLWQIQPQISSMTGEGEDRWGIQRALGDFIPRGGDPLPTPHKPALYSLPAYVFRISLSPSTRQSVFSSRETGSGLCRLQELLLVDGEGLGVSNPVSAKGWGLPLVQGRGLG